jgi:hypothetical protein
MSMKRREFITLLGGVAAAWPLAARAQQWRRVGVLMGRQAYLAAFVQALRQFGWIEGQNLHIDIRWNSGGSALAQACGAVDGPAAGRDLRRVHAQSRGPAKRLPIADWSRNTHPS